MSPRVALFPGTFDPVTNGHVDVIRRAAPLFDRLVVAVSGAGKSTLFPVEERVGLLRETLRDLRDPRLSHITVERFEGLLVAFARAQGAAFLLRGVRTFQDWEYELRMVQMNRHLAPALETVFLAPAVENAFLSSTMIREVSALGADLAGLVPACVAAALEQRKAHRPG